MFRFASDFQQKKGKRKVTEEKKTDEFSDEFSERLHLNLSQPTVLKYLLKTLHYSKAFKSDFIFCLISNFRGVFSQTYKIWFLSDNYLRKTTHP